MDPNEGKLQELLEYVTTENRICPQPQRWNYLWKMLPDKKRVGNGWRPPLPLILGAWWHTSDLEKTERLKQHIEYAEAKGALDMIQCNLDHLHNKVTILSRQ